MKVEQVVVHPYSGILLSNEIKWLTHSEQPGILLMELAEWLTHSEQAGILLMEWGQF